jgi:hypothetical protein
MATSAELATAIQTAQDATAAEVEAIDGLTEVSQTLVQRITDYGDAWDGAVSGLATQVAATTNVDNTSDADKPVSTAQATAIAGRQEPLVSGTNISSVNGISLLDGGDLVVARSPQEMPTIAYDDRANLRTPEAPLPATGDVVNIHHLGMFQYIAVADYTDPYFEDDEMVLEAVDPSDSVTPIGQWVMVLPGHGFIESQELFEKAILWDWMDDSNLDG